MDAVTGQCQGALRASRAGQLPLEGGEALCWVEGDMREVQGDLRSVCPSLMLWPSHRFPPVSLSPGADGEGKAL